MAMKYMNSIRRKPVPKTTAAETAPASAAEGRGPVLTDEDEAFLQHVATSPPTSAGDDEEKQLSEAQSRQPRPLFDDSLDDDLRRLAEERDSDENINTPASTSASASASTSPPASPSDGKGAEKGHKSRRSLWTILKERKWMGETEKTDKGKGRAKDEVSDTSKATKKEEKKEEQDISQVLEKLNLAAINNRVFSVSSDTEQLLEQFKQVFKDLVNGVPTAYRDLESLLTNGDQELQKSYAKLPSFLQKLVEKLPDKMTEKFAPEILAAASSRASKSGINLQHVDKATSTAKKMGIEMPSLQDLAGKPAALAGLLRSIMAFLRARFPALIGVNVLWSVGLFILLMVLWYCYKRGREERLAQEAALAKEGEGESDRVIDVTDEVTPVSEPAAGTAANADPDAQLTRQTEGEMQAPTQIESTATATSDAAAGERETRQVQEAQTVKQ